MSTAENIVPFPDWKTKLARRKNGEPYGDERNVLFALEHAPELCELLRYDAFNDRIELGNEPPWPCASRIGATWSDDDRVGLQSWLQAQGLPISRPYVVQDSVICIAKRNRFDPLHDRLTSLEWDGEPRLSTWLHDYLGAQGDSDYLKAVGRGFCIGAVARGIVPGEKVDTVLVLEAPQGRGKSSAIQIMNYGLGTDYMPDMHSKDAAVQIQGTWINELPELAAVARTDLESMKAFLTRTVDRYRPPYGRNAIERKRRCCFVGTTNLNEYLNDETGGRRFWPVRCRAIDLKALADNIDQLWAEAVQAWSCQEPWHLPQELEPVAEQEQQLRRLVTEQEADLLDYLDARLNNGRNQVLMRDLLTDVGGFKDLAANGREAGGVAKVFSRILTKAGWERLKPSKSGGDRRQPYQFNGQAPSKDKQK